MIYKVDRAIWYRGKGNHDSYLLDSTGQKCCIGFVGLQSNISEDQLINKRSVYNVLSDKWPEWFASGNADDLLEAYSINDNPDITDAERESKLKAIFARNNDEIIFEN